MKLKSYQVDTLATLRRFFESARVAGPKHAYEEITSEPEQASRLGRFGGTYVPLSGLPGLPYVCLRLPTGGGKTLLAAHSIEIARDTWVERDYPLVLWLVPTNTIRQQTAEALKSPRHPYRRALDDAFDGCVRVIDIADFPDLRPHDIRGNCCVVVGTIQTLRVTSTDGRKVYAHHEALEDHFGSVQGEPEGLEKLEGAGIKFSFANLLHLHRPLMIVDEAHNAVTGLSREMQRRVNPSAIIEFSATPHERSNILHSVSAQVLKDEEMIKLPIVLAEHDTWQNAVSGAVAARRALEEPAGRDGSYIRPIVLFQAQPRDEEVTVEVLRNHLIEVEQIPEDRIAVATGDQRELDAIDLFDPKCPIEHVITIEALKEGWDCSFAYVFCSVARIQSARAVEQLLGRVLRMPYAKRREAPELNKAYAFLSEPTFGAAARSLADKLVAMGFEEDEARESIEQVQGELGGWGDLFTQDTQALPTFTHATALSPEDLEVVTGGETSPVAVVRSDDGRAAISISGHVDSALADRLTEALPEKERDAFRQALEAHHKEVELRLSPAQKGDVLRVPRLMAEVQGDLEFADTDVFLESHEWSLLDHSPRFSEEEFAIRETARTFEIDLDGQRVTYQFADEAEQLALDVDVEGWTPEALVLWLDRQVRGPDLRQNELLRWLRALVEHLHTRRGIHISALMRCKFILARRVRERLDSIREGERRKAYQQHLFAPEARVEVSLDHAFAFRDGAYDGQRRYRGRWKPLRHFLGPDHVPAFDGGEDGEEFRCAQALDRLPEVDVWLRNIPRHPASFSLPTASGRFYPDFVARLNDGRLLVVEYKGAHLAEGSDTQEKRVIGQLWERSSQGRGLFIVVERDVDGRDMWTQLFEKVSDS